MEGKGVREVVVVVKVMTEKEKEARGICEGRWRWSVGFR